MRKKRCLQCRHQRNHLDDAVNLSNNRLVDAFLTDPILTIKPIWLGA